MKLVVSEAARLVAAAGALWGILAVSGADVHAATGDSRDVDKRDLEDLARAAPATFALCQQAEAAMRASDLARAGSLYGTARMASPASVVPARGACRVALARQQETIARLACQRAFMLGGTPEDMRNTVAAIMGVTSQPSMTELASATLLADGAVRSAPNEPWGYLARCDIARRLGDRRALDVCTRELARVAPDDAATRELLAAGLVRATPWKWLARGLLLLGLLVTLGHALARASRRSRVSTAVTRSLVTLFFLVGPASSGVAHAQMPKGDRLSGAPIDDLHPEVSIPSVEKQNKDPIEFGYLLQDLLAKAQQASKRKDHAAAARYYHALTIAIPSRAYAFSQACSSYEAAGDRKHALEACRSALSLEDVTVDDFSHFVVLSLAQKEPISAEQMKDLGAAIDHLGTQPGAEVVAQRLRCDVALRVGDVPALKACTAALATAMPNDPKTISFQWALALQQHDGGAARALIDRAKKIGMGKDAVAKMEAATERDRWTRLLKLLLIGLGAVLAGVFVVFGSRRIAAARRATQAAA